MAPINNNSRPNNNQYRDNRSGDENKADRWMCTIEGQRYYFLNKEQAIRCWKNFWEASEPVLVPYSRYVKDPSR
jgi:hypothetical protein